MSTAPAPTAAVPTEARPAGLGALPHANGVAFRVWAPHAEQVLVVGSFNGWDRNRHPLERDDDGTWFADVPEAKIGDEYRYRIRHQGQWHERIDPRARQVTDSQGNAVVHDPAFDWQGDDFTPAPLNELVLYELHVGTLACTNGQCGTLRSAIDKLPHLRELGVNAVQLMPVVEFPGDNGWGYEPSHPYAVESSYGGPLGLKEFVKAAHRYGIAVFLDVIYNHFGPRDLHLWRFDGWHEGRYGGIYFYQDRRADSPWGARPDYTRPEVRAYIRDNAMMWLEDSHLDGLRIDGTYFTRTSGDHEGRDGQPLPEGMSLLQELTDEVRRRFPRVVMIAEDMKGDPITTRPVAAGGGGFHTQWSDWFGHGLRFRATDPQGQRAALDNVRRALPDRYDGDPFKRVIYVESHDNAGKGQRLISTADPDAPESEAARRWLALATTAVGTAPGIPLIFQGQELLSAGGFALEKVEPLDWSRSERFPGVLKFHRDLFALRRNQSGTTAGLTGPHVNVFHANESAGLLAYHRWKAGGPGDDVLVVLNFSGEGRQDYLIGAPRPGVWRVRLDTDRDEYGEGLGRVETTDAAAEAVPWDGLPCRIKLTIGPWTAVVLSQDRE